MTVTRQEVIEYARTFDGVPFLDQGRTSRGMDCLGFIWRVANDKGLCKIDLDTPEIISQFNYGRIPNPTKFLNAMSMYSNRIQVSEATVADVLMYYYKRYPMHLALRTDIGIIHAYQPYGCVRETGLGDSPDKLQPIRAWRFPVFSED